MGAAARIGHKVQAQDLHVVVSGSGATSTVPLPFSGPLSQGGVSTVKINGQDAAVVGSVAINTPSHIPPPGTTFSKPPSNQGSVATGSTKVFIGGKAAARKGDHVTTCNDPIDLPTGTIVEGSNNVEIGG